MNTPPRNDGSVDRAAGSTAVSTSGSTSSGTNRLKQYYVAVSSHNTKLATLIELLKALQAERKMPLAICCGSRDSMDAVVCALMESRMFVVCALHSDMTDRERDFLIGNFTRLLSKQADDNAGETDGTSLALVATDVNLRSISKDLVPLCLHLLIQYDLPNKKEVHSRRLLSLFGAGRERRGQNNVVIDFVVASDVSSFRNLERFGTGSISEMPVHVADVFKA